MRRADIARRMGVSVQSIRNWEAGTRPQKWARRLLAAVAQADNRRDLPKWIVGYDPDNIAVKAVFHLHEPGFIFMGGKVVCWLDRPRLGKKQLRMLILKAGIMSWNDRW